MIVYDLSCAAGHRFEGWFGSAEDFGAQCERGLLECPSCGDQTIGRLPSATRFNTGARPTSEDKPASNPVPAGSRQAVGDLDGRNPVALAQMLYSRMLDALLTKTEDVGKAFPEEARRIHYQEVEARAIRGVASAAEVEALVDEGIEVAQFPMPPERDWN